MRHLHRLPVREAAARVAVQAMVKADWLNDAVKGSMSPRGDFAPFLELDHLRIMMAHPEYLLAMKCLAMRIGAEFHDEDGIRFLFLHPVPYSLRHRYHGRM